MANWFRPLALDLLHFALSNSHCCSWNWSCPVQLPLQLPLFPFILFLHFLLWWSQCVSVAMMKSTAWGESWSAVRWGCASHAGALVLVSMASRTPEQDCTGSSLWYLPTYSLCYPSLLNVCLLLNDYTSVCTTCTGCTTRVSVNLAPLCRHFSLPLSFLLSPILFAPDKLDGAELVVFGCLFLFRFEQPENKKLH